MAPVRCPPWEAGCEVHSAPARFRGWEELTHASERWTEGNEFYQILEEKGAGPGGWAHSLQ